jgi:hypothetical protein
MPRAQRPALDAVIFLQGLNDVAAFQASIHTAEIAWFEEGRARPAMVPLLVVRGRAIFRP